MTTRDLPWTFAALLGLVPLALALAGEPPDTEQPPAPPTNQDDDEEKEYDSARNRQVMRENCLICHSEELIASQRLTPAQWKAVVAKMVGWGAPLRNEQEQPLIEYLARFYSPDALAPEPNRMTYPQALALVSPEEPAEFLVQGDPVPGAKLFAENCATCHGPNGQGGELGPNLVEKPVLLRPTEFQDVVRKGLRRMPGFQTGLRPEQVTDLLAWLRQQRDDEGRTK
jgi:mono/diheme cytochrome c family protein